MEIKINEDTHNPLLNRRKIDFTTTFDGATPSRNEIKNKLAAMMDISPELIVVQDIDNQYGKKEARGYAKIYDDANTLKSVECNYIIERNKPPEETESEA
jgi:small subunit ribosomal protein S24e